MPPPLQSAQSLERRACSGPYCRVDRARADSAAWTKSPVRCSLFTDGMMFSSSGCLGAHREKANLCPTAHLHSMAVPICTVAKALEPGPGGGAAGGRGEGRVGQRAAGCDPTAQLYRWSRTVGEEETSLRPHGSGSWSNNKIDRRRISKSKGPDLMGTSGKPAYMRVRDPACTSASETERDSALGRRSGTLGGFRRSLLEDEKSRP